MGDALRGMKETPEIGYTEQHHNKKRFAEMEVRQAWLEEMAAMPKECG